MKIDNKMVSLLMIIAGTVLATVETVFVFVMGKSDFATIFAALAGVFVLLVGIAKFNKRSKK